MTRAKAFIATIVLAALAMAAVAQAASYPRPPTGPWTLGTGSSFVLKNGKGSRKGTVFLSKLQVKPDDGSECSTALHGTKVKVLGSYPLKQFHRGGYSAWGIGKNIGGEPGYMPAQVVAEGKTVKGAFYVLWLYSDPTIVLKAGVQLGECSFEFSGSHK